MGSRYNYNLICTKSSSNEKYGLTSVPQKLNLNHIICIGN